MISFSDFWPEGAALRARADAAGASRVRFAGQVSDAEKAALLANCRGFVLPSHLRSEAYGMVLVEAAIQRKPLVSCEIGTGTSFVNLDGETGFVVPPESVPALAAALCRLLDEVQMGSRYAAPLRTTGFDRSHDRIR